MLNFADSSVVSSIDYDKEEEKLTIVYKSTGDKYEYSDVSSETVCRLVFAESIGSFLSREIVGGRYPCIRVI